MRTTKSAKKSRGFLDRLRSEAPPRQIRVRWYDTLPAAHISELTAIRMAYNTGQLPGWKISELYRRAKQEFKLPVGIQAFQRFLMNDYAQKP